ncbi:MAG: helix-turn-helix domain-containing protein [Prevotellaceae bacterium]|nr:helix-turn-helix domain-containing protein [Candidatus Colivivens caballi]
MGKLIIEIPPISDKDCYYMQERYKPCFNYPLHKHDAFELNFVEHCAGARRIVGDSIETLGEYDLAFIGCNLEHVWEQHECKAGTIHEITIQMPANLFSDQWFGRRVMEPVKDMFDGAQVGIAFGMKAIMTVYDRLNTLAKSEPSFYAVQNMVSILYDLATSGDFHHLASSHYSHAEIPVTSRRIQVLKEYIDTHYSEEIRMETLSTMVNMTPNALSRFFKQRTNRSISNYINEVRIGQATLLLVSSNCTVVEISYKCGFNTISNFNRTFKAVKGLTPTEFKESYKKNAYLI